MSTRGALRDLRVIDLTLARAGPTAVRQLADFGADVVRIERPRRAASSGLADRRHGHDYQNLHRNKRLLALDLKQPDGLEVLYRLVERADVLVENMRPAVKGRLGIDFASLTPRNPRLIYASISGFGQSGPYAKRGGVDQIAQGMSGLMSVTGPAAGEPMRTGAAITDIAAGLYLTTGILAALHEREKSGRGQWVHTSLLEAGLGLMDFQAARFLVEGETPKRQGNHHPTLPPMGTFPTRDGHVNLAGSSDRLFRALCEALELDDVVRDPRFENAAQRLAHREALEARVAEATRARASAELVLLLNDHGVPAGPVYRVDETFEDRQVEHLTMAKSLEHPKLGAIRLLGQPVHFTSDPAGRLDGNPSFEIRRPAPEPAEHSAAILRELGYDDAAIEDLGRRGVVELASEG